VSFFSFRSGAGSPPPFGLVSVCRFSALYLLTRPSNGPPLLFLLEGCQCLRLGLGVVGSSSSFFFFSAGMTLCRLLFLFVILFVWCGCLGFFGWCWFFFVPTHPRRSLFFFNSVLVAFFCFFLVVVFGFCPVVVLFFCCLLLAGSPPPNTPNVVVLPHKKPPCVPTRAFLGWTGGVWFSSFCFPPQTIHHPPAEFFLFVCKLWFGGWVRCPSVFAVAVWWGVPSWFFLFVLQRTFFVRSWEGFQVFCSFLLGDGLAGVLFLTLGW